MRLTMLAAFSSLSMLACGFDPRADVRVASPSFPIDVDAERGALEEALCAAADASACDVLRALDTFDDGQASSPPRLPLALPRELPALRDQSALLVEPWLDEQRAVHEIMPSLRVPLDLAGGDAASAALDPALLEGAELRAASLRIEENTLTFSLPQLRVGIERDGTVVDIGIIEAAQVRDGDGAQGELALVHLVQDGSRSLVDAVRAGGAVVVVSPEGPLQLSEGATTLVRPGGSARLSLVIDLAIAVAPMLAAAAR